MTNDIDSVKRLTQLESRQQSMGDRLLLMEAHYEDIKEAVNVIKDNHLKHVQDDTEKMQISISSIEKTQAVMGADMKWVKKFVWVIVSTAVLNLFGMVVLAFKLFTG